MTEAVGLTQEQLENVVGDAATILSLDSKGRKLYVWSCWEKIPDGFEIVAAQIESLVQRSDFSYIKAKNKEKYQVEELKKRWLCADGRVRRKVGFLK